MVTREDGDQRFIDDLLLAVLILQFLSTGLNLLFQSSGSNFLKEFAWGATLLVVLALGRVRYRRLLELAGAGAAPAPAPRSSSAEEKQ